MMKLKRFMLVSLLITAANLLFAQNAETEWVDSIYQAMSPEQRVGQLFNIRANQHKQKPDTIIDTYIKNYHVGGVTFFRGDADVQVAFTNRWQALSELPIIVAIDGEWGLGMRINNSVSYPYQMTLGALAHDSLIEVMGYQIAEQCHRMGIHLNFAPCLDVNNNPKNPVIGMRSFGENPALVARKASAYAMAMQRNGLLTSAKHFPGHGNTATDSHSSLPRVNSSINDIKNIEFVPFQSLINQGINGVMVGHLYLPAIEPIENTSSSLSKNVITGILINDMKFKGLIYTDALEMKGASQVITQDSLSYYALMAGADVLLMPVDLPASFNIILQAAENDNAVKQRVEESCRKILSYKYRLGLTHAHAVLDTTNVLLDLKKKEYFELNQQLFDQAVTLLKNSKSVLPLQKKTSKKIALLTVDTEKTELMRDALQEAGFEVEEFLFDKSTNETETENLLAKLKKYPLVIVNIRNTSINAARKFGIGQETVQLVNQLQRQNKIILNVFASPYALDYFRISKNVKALVMAYEDRVEAEQAVTKLLLGQITPQGSLPVSVNKKYVLGDGLSFNSNTADADDQHYVPYQPIRNQYTEKIDSVVLDGIAHQAFPGCQIVAMKDGNIIYNKSFGKFTYDGNREVQKDDLYDIASLTKMFGSALSLMKLYQDSLIDLNDRLSDYFPFFNNTNKADIKLIELYTHQSGMTPWIPIYREAINTSVLVDSIDEKHTLRVAEGIYADPDFWFRINDTVIKSPLHEKKYCYSDIGFYYIPAMIELLTNQSMSEYLNNNFFKPMHLKTIGYHPTERFQKYKIVPTENDTIFRKQLLQGDVHDQTCALMGGVSGHAGMFSNAEDLALIMQMLLDGGNFDELHLLDSATINTFTTAVFPENENRRGIVFDKPPLDVEAEFRTPTKQSSLKSFGHTGFTGTFAWADPENKLVVVFLSNRIYPDASNNKLSQMDIRTKIHALFYEAVKE